MEGHEERAQEAEYELAEMEEQSDGLADEIIAAKDDWEAKKADESVPGAGSGEDVVEREATGEGAPEVEDSSS
jgi:hypothetical protein